MYKEGAYKHYLHALPLSRGSTMKLCSAKHIITPVKQSSRATTMFLMLVEAFGAEPVSQGHFVLTTPVYATTTTRPLYPISLSLPATCHYRRHRHSEEYFVEWSALCDGEEFKYLDFVPSLETFFSAPSLPNFEGFC